MNRRRAALLSALALSIAYGCSSSDDTTTSTGDAGPDASASNDASTADASSIVDGGGGSDSSSSDASGGGDSASTFDAGPGIAQMAASSNTTCALYRSGNVWCWGNNEYGQRGDGTFAGAPRPEPSQVPSLANVTRIAAGVGESFCAIESDGSLWCWGWNYQDGLGHDNGYDGGNDAGDVTCSNNFPCATTPQKVAGISNAVDVAIGYGHACARVAGGAVYCWGDNRVGQLGHDNAIDGTCKDGPCNAAPSIVPGAPAAGSLTAGEFHSCAGAGSSIACWGDNFYGEIGLSPADSVEHPTLNAVTGITGALSFHSKEYFNCAVLADAATCFGSNEHGELAYPVDDSGVNIKFPSPPQPTVPLGNIADVTTGGRFACARLRDGSVWCWGNDTLGEIAQPEDAGLSCEFGEPCNPVPMQIPVVHDVVEVTSGASHTCVRESDDSVWCWGFNRQGQLGHDASVDGKCSGNFICNIMPARVFGLPAQ
jgi:alpha-tubulin suppressor-like RCC1 family protein